MANVKITGLKRYKRKIASLTGAGMKKVLGASATEIILNTKKEAMLLTPVDTGNLKSSFDTRIRSLSSTMVTAEVANPVEYAAPVHENLASRHTVGQAKYLEEAFNKEAPRFETILVKNLKKAIRK